MPVIPATWETEAGESIELGSCSELRFVTLHFSLGDRVRLYLKKKKEYSESKGKGLGIKYLIQKFLEIQHKDGKIKLRNSPQQQNKKMENRK